MLIACLGCQRPSLPHAPPPAPPTPVAQDEGGALPLSLDRGICLAHSWQGAGTKGYGTAASAQTLDWMVGLGTTDVSLTPFGWMGSLGDSEIKGEHRDAAQMPEGGETGARLEAVTAQARARGLRVMLKPHLWVKGGAWRGDIVPGDWRRWWAQYEEFLLYYARMAQRLGIERLVVGVELVQALGTKPEAFLKVIASVRRVYAGQITYSANWDESVPVEIWQALDAIGVQFYPPLSATDPSPSEALLRLAIARHLEPWRELAQRTGKPLWMTEVGYKSAATSVTEPFGWPERLPQALRASDEAIQERAYGALFHELAQAPEVQAVYLWKVFTDRKGQEGEEGAFGFSPRGKRAQETVRRAFGGGQTGNRRQK